MDLLGPWRTLLSRRFAQAECARRSSLSPPPHRTLLSKRLASHSLPFLVPSKARLRMNNPLAVDGQVLTLTTPRTLMTLVTNRKILEVQTSVAHTEAETVDCTRSSHLQPQRRQLPPNVHRPKSCTIQNHQGIQTSGCKQSGRPLGLYKLCRWGLLTRSNRCLLASCATNPIPGTRFETCGQCESAAASLKECNNHPPIVRCSL